MASGNIPAHPWASCRPSRLGSATFLDDLAQTCTDEVDVDGSKKKDGERGWWEGVRVEVERSRCEAGDGSPPHSCTVGVIVPTLYWFGRSKYENLRQYSELADVLINCQKVGRGDQSCVYAGGSTRQGSVRMPTGARIAYYGDAPIQKLLSRTRRAGFRAYGKTGPKSTGAMAVYKFVVDGGHPDSLGKF
eukprot:286192-Rhodomonas_salina.1